LTLPLPDPDIRKADTDDAIESAQRNFEAIAKSFPIQGANLADGLSGPTGPAGPEGDPGIIISATPPSNTDSLWADTTEAGDVGIGPTGPSGPTGATGAGFDGQNSSSFSYSVNSTTPVLVASASPSSAMTAGSQLGVRMRGLLNNNSGASRTYVWTIQFNGNTYLTYTEGAALAASATNQSAVDIEINMVVHSTSAAYFQMKVARTAPSAANTRQDISTTTTGQIFNTTSSNLTTGGALTILCHGQNATASQTFTRRSLQTIRLA
jgi:hypothetical protein